MVFALAGCKTHSLVDMRMVMPLGAQIMSIPKDQVFLMASPVSQPMPVFPKGAPKNVSAHICVELVISESGAISSAVPVFALPECPLSESQLDQRFVASVVEATTKWQFLAAATCAFRAGAPMTDDCSGDDAVVTPVSIKVSYVFSFQNGGTVSAKAKQTL